MTLDGPHHVAAPKIRPHDGLAARERELSAIYENVPGILFYVAIDPDGEFRFLSMSQAGLLAVGLTREQVVGAFVRDIIPPPSRDLVLNHYRNAIRSGRTVRWKEVSVYPAGRRVGEVAVTPLYDASGVATHLIGIVHDITEREHLEEALHQREDRLSFLLRLNDAVRPLNDPVEIQDVTVRLLGEHLRVNRVVYATIEGDEFIVRRSYANGVAAPPPRGSIGISGEVMLGAYRRGDTVAVSDVATDPRFTEAARGRLFANEIVAFVSMMLHKEGRWLAAFGVHHATARTWTPDEIALIEATGERMWAAAERARTETALRLALTQLQASEERFSIIHDRAPFAISLTSVPDGRIVSVNDAFEQLFEFSRGEVIGRTRVELGISTPALNALLVDELERNGKVRDLEVHRRTKSGAERILLLAIDPVNVGGHEYLLTTVIDVTEKRHAEAALRTSEHTLRLSLQAARMGTWRYELHARIFRSDDVWKALHGLELGTVIGTLEDACRCCHPDDVEAFQRRVAEPLEDGVTSQYEYRIMLASGETRWIASQWMRESGTPSLVGVVRDVTAHKHAELTLQDRNRDQERALEHRTLQLRQLASDLTLAELQAREQLAKTLHDGLQQLLVSAALNLDRKVKHDAERGAEPSDPLVQARDHLDEAIAAARSLSVELSPPLLHGSGLPAALTWLAERTRNEYGLVVHVAVDHRANSDRKDVRALLFESVRELLFNVVKHAKVDRVQLDLALGDDDALCITVSDQGIGFDPAALVERAKAGQVGWGLVSIGERLALLGGRFEIDSAPARGARFRLIAPRGARGTAGTQSASRPAAIGPMTHVGAGGAAAPALRILIADDHAAVRTVFRDLLQERPELQVVGEAANGREAIAEAHRLRPDVILMDVSMPEMDGIVATRQLRAELPSVQILGLSTQPRPLDRHPIEQAGATDFFTKGVDTRRLIDHLLGLHSVTMLRLPSQPA